MAVAYHTSFGGRVDEVRTEDGASATLERDERGIEILGVRDRAGQVLFTYSPTENVTRLHVPLGDLELDVPNGNIRLRSGGRVAIESERALSLCAPEIEATAARGRLVLDEGSVVAKKLELASERLVVTAGVIETRAVQIVERARDVFREAEGLAQTTAGRIRMITKDTVHMLAGRLLMRAQGDVKIDGERIDIG